MKSKNTKIITTIGPASANNEVLSFFKDHRVTISRLNFSHGTVESHSTMANLCKQYGFEIMIDTAGPKVLLGALSQPIEIIKGSTIILEFTKTDAVYPFANNEGVTILPCQFKIHEFVKIGATILIDDGKVNLEVVSVNSDFVTTIVVAGGVIKSNKGVNLPGSSVNIPFLVERDLSMIADCLPIIKPEWIALSFVKNNADLITYNNFVDEIVSKNNLGNYKPKICVKIEMAEAIENFEELLSNCDMIMIARGDLAVETSPAHVMVPVLQDNIVKACQEAGKPFIVATQMLESMMSAPVPTRAEVSDIYRAVKYNEADYIMLSGETAAGSFPIESVSIMDQVITLCENN